MSTPNTEPEVVFDTSDIISQNWLNRFHILQDFWQQHKRLPKLRDSHQGFGIGAWLNRQKSKNLSGRQLELLNNLSADWNKEVKKATYFNDWEYYYFKFVDFWQEHHRLPKQTESYSDVKIGMWLYVQKRAYNNQGTVRLTDRQITLLDEITQTWRPRKQKKDKPAPVESSISTTSNITINIPAGQHLTINIQPVPAVTTVPAVTAVKSETKKRSTSGVARINPSNQLSLHMYQSGTTVNQIARERNLAHSTIVNHLAFYVGAGDLNLDDFVLTDRIQPIVTAIKASGQTSFLKPIKELLPVDFTYDEVRMVLEHYKRQPELYSN